jgi:membrane-associated PAP2 superfamily phosphatase
MMHRKIAVYRNQCPSLSDSALHIRFAVYALDCLPRQHQEALDSRHTLYSTIMMWISRLCIDFAGVMIFMVQMITDRML